MEIRTKFNINDKFFTIIGRNTIAERNVKAIIFEDNTGICRYLNEEQKYGRTEMKCGMFGK